MPAYYARSVESFLADSVTSILGVLSQANAQAKFLQLESAAIEAWRQQVEILQQELSALLLTLPESTNWGVLLEFPIPRRQRRVDTVLLAIDLIFVIEFKSGKADHSAFRQVEDYALDLADFHAPSRSVPLIPIVVAPDSVHVPSSAVDHTSPVRSVIACKPGHLAIELARYFRLYSPHSQNPISLEAWNNGILSTCPNYHRGRSGNFLWYGSSGNSTRSC